MISGQEHPDHEHDVATDVCTLVPKNVFSRYFQRGEMKTFTVLALASCLFVSQRTSTYYLPFHTVSSHLRFQLFV